MTVWAWLALALLGQGVDRTEGTGQADVPTPVQLNLPVDRDFLLTIVDERRLADGRSATFLQSVRIRFSRGQGNDWRALIDQARFECSGPDDICSAFQQMLAQRAQVIRRFRISEQGVIWPDGAVTPLNMPDRGLPGANAPVIVADVEARNPGQLESGELREALQFVGFGSAASGPAVDPDIGDVQSIDRDASGRMTIHLRRPINTGENTSRIIQDQRSVIDVTSGLLLDSRTETRIVGDENAGAMISLRHWQLVPMMAP